MDIDALIAKHGLMSDQVDRTELKVILSELTRVRNAPGAVVELGCYVGTTSLYLRRLIGPERPFHVYDSFAGLPEKASADQSMIGEAFKPGELGASKKAFVATFKKAGLRAPVIHKAWFADLTEADMPDSIVFAFLDGDYYESIKTSLRLIESKLAPGAIIVVDDYANEALPGAAKAVDEWVSGSAWRVRVVASLAILTKPS